MSKINLGVIGMGSIFPQYLKVLNSIKNFEIKGIVTKSNIKAKKFTKNNSILLYKDIESLVSDSNIHAIIVLVSPDQIFNVLKKIIPYKKVFFTEKPIGLNYRESKAIKDLIDRYKTPNIVGLNRRFYSIFHKGLKIINRYGKLQGALIEGHERFWKIENKKNKKIIDNWIYANSCHTVDLIRFFGGEYKELYSVKNNSFNKNPDQFSVIFKSKQNIIITYISHWYSPGGWSITLFGNGISVVFKPLENGYTINKNFKITRIKPNKNDIEFKAGLYEQMKYFEKFINTKKLIWPLQDIKENFKTVKLIKSLIG